MKTNILKSCSNKLRNSTRNLTSEASELKTQYDAIVVGGGHNGLTAVFFKFHAASRAADRLFFIYINMFRLLI